MGGRSKRLKRIGRLQVEQSGENRQAVERVTLYYEESSGSITFSLMKGSLEHEKAHG